MARRKAPRTPCPPRRAAPPAKTAKKPQGALALEPASILQAEARGDRAALADLANRAHNAILYDLALSALDALERLGHPEPETIRKKRAQILVQSGRCAAAIPILKELAAAHPEDAIIGALLAEALYKANQRTEAVAQLARLPQLSLPQQLQLCTWLEEIGQRAEAEARLRAVLAEDPAALGAA